MRQEIVADLGAFVDDDMRVEDRVAPEPDVLADDGEGADGAVFADDRGGRDVGHGMNSGRGSRGLVEEGECACQIEVRVFGDEGRYLDAFDGFGYQDRAGARVFDLGRVFWIGEKG